MALFNKAQLLLPAEEYDIEKWAVIACDQYTSQSEYWEQVEAMVGAAPSTLRIILPEIYLEQRGVEQRIQSIHHYMADVTQKVLSRKMDGYIYVERTLNNGKIRQGLVGCVDLEAYSYQPGATCDIRPSEKTVVERIPPRLAVRRGAPLESPHIVMLVDDPDEGLVEPIAEQKDRLELLYDTELMMEGGRLRGWFLPGDEWDDSIQKSIARLQDPASFRARYQVDDKVQPFAMAVGDGNHSLATAKALWEEIKPTLSHKARENHPARYCLVELENIQSPSIEVEPIYRLLFNADWAQFFKVVERYVEKNSAQMQLLSEKDPAPAKGEFQFEVLQGDRKVILKISSAPQPLPIGVLEEIIDLYADARPEVRIDYIHGVDAVDQLARDGGLGIILPPFEKSDLFKGVALGGVLPKKTFSIGHANEKRYYMECRRIVE